MCDEDNSWRFPFITIDDYKRQFICIQPQRTLSTKGAESQTKKDTTEGIAFSFLHWYNRVMGFIAKIITNKPTDFNSIVFENNTIENLYTLL